MIILMVTFFEKTWFLWWLVAIIMIGRWCWITFFSDQHGNENNSDTWKEPYRSALFETDTAKMEQAVQEAEGAILLALAASVFRSQDSDRLELQDALKNLHTIRESAPRAEM